jgi:hypothetical protein
LLIFDLAIGAAGVFLFDTVITVTDHTFGAFCVLDYFFDTIVSFFIIGVVFWAFHFDHVLDTLSFFQLVTFWAGCCNHGFAAKRFVLGVLAEPSWTDLGVTNTFGAFDFEAFWTADLLAVIFVLIVTFWARLNLLNLLT